MKTATDVVMALAATDSRLEKEKIIRQAYEKGIKQFFLGCSMAYDALRTFNVKQVPFIEQELEDDSFESTWGWDQFVKLATLLETRQLTGNSAREALRNAANVAPIREWNNWYRNILIKDLKCGISEVTVNKILNDMGDQNLIPSFDCQLAKNGEDHPDHLKGRKMLDVKLDGVRILTVMDVKNKTVSQFTRNGKINDRFTGIIKNLEKLLPLLNTSIVLDGEMVSRNFQQLMTQLNRKQDVDTSDARLALFDIIPLEDFRQGQCSTSQEDRHTQLCELMPLFQEHCQDTVYVIPKLVLDMDTAQGKNQFKQFNRETLEAGLEGIMIKDPKSPYRCKRSHNWLKIKPVVSFDLTVVSVEMGEPGKKYENMLGALVCQGQDNDKMITVNVGSGFSDEQRVLFWANKDQLVGQTVEILADAVTQNQNGTYSLRFPRFERFRGVDRGDKI